MACGPVTMSKFDLIWNEAQNSAARMEGWELVVVVDEGKPVSHAYLDIFDSGPRFACKRSAAQFVIQSAQGGSRRHIEALSACSASRLTTAPGAKKGRTRA